MKYEKLSHRIQVACQQIYTKYIRAAFASLNNTTTRLDCIDALHGVERKLSEHLDIHSANFFKEFRQQVVDLYEIQTKNIKNEFYWQECHLTRDYVYSYVMSAGCKVKRYRSIDDPWEKFLE